eukprot:8920787-Ditylum_brightwellii.AAC.1
MSNVAKLHTLILANLKNGRGHAPECIIAPVKRQIAASELLPLSASSTHPVLSQPLTQITRLYSSTNDWGRQIRPIA